MMQRNSTACKPDTFLCCTAWGQFIYLSIWALFFFLCLSSEGEKHVVLAPLVRPKGEPAVLSAAPGGPQPAWRDRARGLRRSNRRFGRLFLSSVHRSRPSLLSARRRRSAEQEKLGERSPLRQPHLHFAARPRPRSPLPRLATTTL